MNQTERMQLAGETPSTDSGGAVSPSKFVYVVFCGQDGQQTQLIGVGGLVPRIPLSVTTLNFLEKSSVKKGSKGSFAPLFSKE